MIIKLPHHHPYDWIQHFFLCLILSFFLGWKISAVVGITIEATQWDDFGWLGWDHLFDLIADGLGILAGLWLRSLLT